MKKMCSNLFLVVACAGAFFMSCSDDSDSVAGGAVEDSGIVADLDTIFVHDTVKVKVKVKDTVKVKVKVKDTVSVKDTLVIKDTVKTKDTVVVHDTVSFKDSTLIIEKGSISGVSQKGPFAKGSSVTAFELDGTNELKQTGRSFNGTISSDDGSFKIKNVSLVSSYVHLTATGAYRNEISGKKSSDPITLRALSKLGDENAKVNVNLITHLEYDRVAYLLENDSKMELAGAKKQAEKEIFAMFYIDADDFGYSEDLNIFGTEDANAALLAVSVMLPTDYSASGVMERLTALSQDMAEDGTWDSESEMDSMAFFAKEIDLGGKLPTIRKNVLSWKISEDVPDFEKYVRHFWYTYFGLDDCGSIDAPVGTVKKMPKGEPDESVRYTCVDSASVGKVWRIADDIEKDTADLGRDFEEGEIRKGIVNKDSLYVFDDGAFRHAGDREIYLNKGCTKAIEGKTFKHEYSAYTCTNGLWEFDLANSDKGTVKDGFDDHVYKTVGIGGQVWMAENVKYYLNNRFYCFQLEAENCEGFGATFDIFSFHDGVGFDPNSNEYTNPTGDNINYCGVQNGKCILQEEHQGVCPVGYHIPSAAEFEKLMAYVDLFNGDEDVATSLKSKNGWIEKGAAGTDRFGFHAYPGGYENTYHNRITVADMGVVSTFWIKLDEGVGVYSSNARYFSLDATSASFKKQSIGDFHYARCVKNATK